MASLNKVFLIGNLTKNPEVRYTPKGMAVSDLRLAVSRQFKTTDGQTKDETCYLDVVVWGRQAETCGEYLKRGAPILVEGRLQYDEWEKDGEKRTRLRVVAERVQFLSGPRSAQFRDTPTEETEQADGAAGNSIRSGSGEAGAGPVGTGADEDDLPF